MNKAGFESSTPLTVVSRETLDAQGITNVANFLNQLPAFTANISPSTTTLSANNGVFNLNLTDDCTS